MPLYLPRENASYLDGAVPTLVLVSSDPVEGLPLLRLRSDTPLPCEGWRLLAGLTASVVDGPGDAGIFVQGAASPEEADKLLAWLDAVDRAAGAVVLVVHPNTPLDSWAALANDGRTRGGFVPAMQRSASDHGPAVRD